MQVEQISCTKKYETIVNINIDDLDKNYDDNDRLSSEINGNICTEDKNCYHFRITMEDEILSGSDAEYYDPYATKDFGIQVDLVSEMKCEADLEVTFIGTTELRTLGVRVKSMEEDNFIKFCLLRDTLSSISLEEKKRYQCLKIKAIKGKITLAIIPEFRVILKEKLVKNFSKLMDSMLTKEKSDEFKLQCQNEIITFHKPLLKTISGTFRNMLDNPNFKETQDGIMTIKETLPETIKSFKRIFYDKKIEEKDLTIDLMLFANQYDIKPLVDLCSDHLEKSFTKDNIIDIVDTAFKTDDEELLKKAINFIQLNVEDFQEDVTWKDYMKSNPNCTAKIMFMLMKS